MISEQYKKNNIYLRRQTLKTSPNFSQRNKKLYNSNVKITKKFHFSILLQREFSNFNDDRKFNVSNIEDDSNIMLGAYLKDFMKVRKNHKSFLIDIF